LFRQNDGMNANTFFTPNWPPWVFMSTPRKHGLCHHRAYRVKD
jgi:hypothetical protein